MAAIASLYPEWDRVPSEVDAEPGGWVRGLSYSRPSRKVSAFFRVAKTAQFAVVGTVLRDPG